MRTPASLASGVARGDQGDRRAVLALGPGWRCLRARGQPETLARALATEEARKRFAERYGVDDAKLEEAVHAGLVRGVDDAEDAGALSPIVAVPLRELAQRVPVEEGIKLINDASPLFDDAQGLLDLFGGQDLGGLGQLIP